MLRNGQNFCSQESSRGSSRPVAMGLAVLLQFFMTTGTSASCLDPDLSKVDAGTRLTLCDGSTGVGTYVAPDLSNLSPANIAAGVTVNGVNGTYQGTTCTSDNQTNCTTTSQYPSIDASALTNPYNLRATAGGFGQLKYCRSGYDLAVYDHPSTPVNMNHMGKTFSSNATTDLLTIPANTFIQSIGPVPIRFTTTGSLPSPLIADATYYSVWISSTTIKVASSEADALASSTIDLTTGGSGTNKMFPVGNGIPDYWDAGNSLNSLTQTTGPWFTNNYFGSQYLCTQNDWTVLAPSPDGITVTPGSAVNCDANADDCMFQDLMTGQIWTEINPGGGGTSLTWAESRKFCDDLIFGGFSDWRLPQIKEFAQAYINGITRTGFTHPAGGAALTSWMWSATTQGRTPWNGTSNFVYQYYGSGQFQSADVTSFSGLVTRFVRN